MPPPQVTGPEDIPISFEDRVILQDEFTTLFDTNDRAVAFLRQARFPGWLIPTWTDAFQFWNTIFVEIENGAMPAPYRRLLAAALRLYGSNDTLNDITRRYHLDVATEPDQDQHLIVRIGSVTERTEVESWLREHGIDPQPMWFTRTAASYRINDGDDTRIRELLRNLPDLVWTLVPPGAPDHLIRQLFVEGPDGRMFRISDIPAHSTIGSLTSEVLEHYPEDALGADRPTVTDHVGPDGQGRRTNPDSTLHEEGIAEGDQLRLAFHSTVRHRGAEEPLLAEDTTEAGTAFRMLKVPFHRVLIFGASPVDRPRVRADQETRAIHQAARLGHLEVEPRSAARAADLAEVRRYRPDILHLACHGDGDHLVFEDNQGESHPVPAATIAAALRNYVSGGGRLRGIVLGACDGEEIAPEFAGIAGWVVAHRKRLDDACGVVFTRFFYEELRHTTDFRAAAYAAADDAAREDLSCDPVSKNLIVLPNGS